MSLFQNKILEKYRAAKNDRIQSAYRVYSAYFFNPEIQENIRNSKEEQFQEGFLRELFVNVLGYTLNPAPNYNLITEQKNETNSKKADGAILVNGEVTGVIELKDLKTTDLKTVEEQAFRYKNYHRKAAYVVTSNFEKLRFYIDHAVDHIEFNLFTLSADDFSVLWLCLAYENIAKDLPKQIKTESVGNEDRITKELYRDYSRFKRELFDDLTANNPQYDRLLLFKKSQKLLDRLLFVFFAEDRNLLPPNSIAEIIQQWETLKDLDAYTPLYDRLKKYFSYMNTGHKGKKHDIFAYNGGLFRQDEILDSIVISDSILRDNALRLSRFDFDSEVDVNILGHIFENSLTEIEEITNALSDNNNIKGINPLVNPLAVSKRKKDGVFYTPRYITAYITGNTLGKLCADKKAELEIDQSEYFADKRRQKATRKKLDDKLKAYREWLLSLTVCDPACGSGAFLNAALDYLIAEHSLIDELTAKLHGASIVFPDIENAILENNLYGVDINEESVEIAKLALWLRTAKPHRKLNSLNNNIKCGNSLISDPEVAGEKAFDWHKEFPHVFKEKVKKAFHVTTAIHDSRTSQRMIDYKVRERRFNGALPGPQVYPLDEEDELIISKTILEIVREDELNVLAYNICIDHLHILLVCEAEELDKIVGRIKGKTARACNLRKGINPLVKEEGERSVPLWTQKFGRKEMTSEEQLYNTIEYIQNNRIKHELPHNKGIHSLVKSMLCTIDYAFRIEYKGGFDVVIGNPPYVRLESIKDVSEQLAKSGYSTFDKRGDLYCLFVERGFDLLKRRGFISFIMPNKWMQAGYGKSLREYFLVKELIRLIDFGDIQIFEGATTYPCIFVAKNAEPKDKFFVSVLNAANSADFYANVQFTEESFDTKQFSGETWIISSQNDKHLLERLQKDFPTLAKFINGEANYGIKFGLTEAFLINEDVRQNLKTEHSSSEKIIGSVLRGRDLKRYGIPDISSVDYIILAEYGIYKYLQKEYPAIYKHLITYEDKLRKRGQCTGSKETSEKPYTGQHHWLELDNNPSSKYLALFSKPKIMYQKFQVKPCFIYDEKGLFCNDSMWIIPTENKALLAIDRKSTRLNSSH